MCIDDASFQGYLGMNKTGMAVLAAATLSLLLTVGCVSSKTVNIYSEPPGANISLDGHPKGTAPVTDDLEFDDSEAVHLVEATMPGYKKATINIAYEPSEKSDYTLTLERLEIVSVDLIELSPSRSLRGTRLTIQKQRTSGYLDDSEPSPNCRDVTNVTRHDADGPCIGRIAISPSPTRSTSYSLLYDSIKRTSETGRFYSHLAKLDIGSRSVRDLSPGNHHDFSPSFSPDGRTIHYSSNRFFSRYKLWAMSEAGEPGPKIYGDFEQDAFWPDTSPDGQKIAFSSFTGSDRRPMVWKVDAVGARAQPLREGHEPRFNPMGGSSPDILFSAFSSEAGKQRLFIMDFNGRNVKPVSPSLPSGVEEKNASWSPDGLHIVFASNQGKDRNGTNNWDIWVMNASGGGRTRLTENGSWDDMPVWGSDGYIYFRSNRGGRWNIWRLQPRLD